MARSSTTFAKGQSGNPKGRPQVEKDVRAALQAHGKALVNKLLAIAMNDNHSEQLRAIVAALDRGYGRPAQTSTVVIDDQIRTVEEGQRRADALLAKLGIVVPMEAQA